MLITLKDFHFSDMHKNMEWIQIHLKICQYYPICLLNILIRISEASILEGTRLGTPLPISLAHIVTKNTKLRGYTIPRKNTCVIANLYAGNR